MALRLKPLQQLEGVQELASRPGGHAELSASAGTGKTHVLTARVLRLLLAGSDPAPPPRLTSHERRRAGEAAVRLKHSERAGELMALGEHCGPKACDDAPTLFAKLLDSTGGGLRVQTIHALAQGRPGGVPSESGLRAGVR